jgi:hypothetical protein
VRLVEEAEAQPEVLVVGNIVARSAKDHNAGVWRGCAPARNGARAGDGRRRATDDEMPDGSPLPRRSSCPVAGPARRSRCRPGP